MFDEKGPKNLSMEIGAGLSIETYVNVHGNQYIVFVGPDQTLLGIRGLEPFVDELEMMCDLPGKTSKLQEVVKRNRSKLSKWREFSVMRLDSKE